MEKILKIDKEKHYSMANHSQTRMNVSVCGCVGVRY